MMLYRNNHSFKNTSNMIQPYQTLEQGNSFGRFTGNQSFIAAAMAACCCFGSDEAAILSSAALTRSASFALEALKHKKSYANKCHVFI